jgi:hypothetical protein
MGNSISIFENNLVEGEMESKQAGAKPYFTMSHAFGKVHSGGLYALRSYSLCYVHSAILFST